MDFARKQLEKYGWCEGKGLGKAENGIQHAIKPKPKHGQGGIGHDIAEEFTNHWWQKVYNSAADNIEVNKKQNGEIENFSTKKGESINIVTKTWVKPKRSKNKKLSTTKSDSKMTSIYKDKFINRATLTNGVTLIENRKSDDDDDDSDTGDTRVPKIHKLTDEELFSACGGRTAHKGARHGIKSNGKLLRINNHEDDFLEKMKSLYKSGEKKSLQKNKLNKTDKNADECSDKIIHNSYCKTVDLSSEQSCAVNISDDSGKQIDRNTSNKRKRKRRSDVLDTESHVTICQPHEIIVDIQANEFGIKKKKICNKT